MYSTTTISVDDYSTKSETMVAKRRAWSTDCVGDGILPPFGEYELEETLPLHKGEEFIECDESEKKRFSWHRRKTSEDSSFPGWPPGNPQAAGDDFRSTLIFTAKKRKSTFSFAVMAFCLFGFSLYFSAWSTLRMALSEASDLVAFSERLSRQMSTAERDVRLLERELAALDAMEQQKEDMEEEKKILHQAAEFANPQVIQEMNIIQRKLRYSANRAEKLKEQVKDISRRDTISKYGAGVKQVEIQLIFPGNLEGPTTFVIEMAPIDIMPHSVFTFLEMVSSGLLNGCSFILNALHVLKVAPLPYDGTSASNKARDFLESGLESVAFREYSHEYPHKRYTVGFAADGSPSFYINTEDNTEIHVGDPCFAKIVSGFDTIKRLEASPTRNGIWFEHRIGIKRATVL